jgi:hypothetical protein
MLKVNGIGITQQEDPKLILQLCEQIQLFYINAAQHSVPARVDHFIIGGNGKSVANKIPEIRIVHASNFIMQETRSGVIQFLHPLNGHL